MLSQNELFCMSQMEITEIDPAMLADISKVVIDGALPHEEKIISYMEQIGNPYCFLSGGIPVRIRLAGDKPLSDSLIRYFSRLKQT